MPLSILFNKSKTLSLDFSFCLTTSDLNYLLHDENGMNDECMDFWWDKVQQASPELKETSDGLIFLCPSVMHLVSTLESIDDVEDALSDLNLSRKGLILMPIRPRGDEMRRHTLGSTMLHSGTKPVQTVRYLSRPQPLCCSTCNKSHIKNH